MWNDKLTSALLEFGFVQSKHDYSLFVKTCDNVFIALLVYVDDIVVTGNVLDEVNKVKDFFKKYLLELLAEYGLTACKPALTPIEAYVDDCHDNLKVKIDLPVEIFVDNKSAIQIANNPVFHERTKHFEIDLYFVRDKITSGLISPIKIESKDNISDVFTKGLHGAQHAFLVVKVQFLELWCLQLKFFFLSLKSVIGTSGAWWSFAESWMYLSSSRVAGAVI
ncbi:uncharacterized protein [Rutidosis leptorrhynchoides]|uniref:uncharacterized protein n=1 Tax=Rutidosis leptorrhynchoides TaxID=125765 RepID=UPI003A99D9BF